MVSFFDADFPGPGKQWAVKGLPKDVNVENKHDSCRIIK
jgi:hypothetical protein